MFVFVYHGLFAKFVDFLIPGGITLKNIMFHIAVAHSIFNVLNAFLFLPFVGGLEKLCKWLVPRRQGDIELGPQYLEKHLLETPSIALEQARLEIARMLGVASDSVSNASKGFFENHLSILKTVPKLEQAVDHLQSEITQYLVELSQRNLSEDESQELPVLIHSVNDAERIGDHAENIVELAERKIDQKLPFTDQAMKELHQIWGELEAMMKDVQEALKEDDVQLAEDVLARELRVNKLYDSFRRSHVNRLNEGRCNIISGVVFMDFIDNLEKIGDHLTNIAEGVKRKMRWGSHEDEPESEAAVA
jgi:phosphate:Na+ symporter